MAETITVNGIELEKRFLKELCRLALDWTQKKRAQGHIGEGSASGMEESIADAVRNG